MKKSRYVNKELEEKKSVYYELCRAKYLVIGCVKKCPLADGSYGVSLGFPFQIILLVFSIQLRQSVGTLS